ncbi:hypothetical protein DMENIID0001_071430 [Sergentomyia squamirostris]
MGYSIAPLSLLHSPSSSEESAREYTPPASIDDGVVNRVCIVPMLYFQYDGVRYEGASSKSTIPLVASFTSSSSTKKPPLLRVNNHIILIYDVDHHSSRFATTGDQLFLISTPKSLPLLFRFRFTADARIFISSSPEATLQFVLGAKWYMRKLVANSTTSCTPRVSVGMEAGQNNKSGGGSA